MLKSPFHPDCFRAARALLATDVELSSLIHQALKLHRQVIRLERKSARLTRQQIYSETLRRQITDSRHDRS